MLVRIQVSKSLLKIFSYRSIYWLHSIKLSTEDDDFEIVSDISKLWDEKWFLLLAIIKCRELRWFMKDSWNLSQEIFRILYRVITHLKWTTQSHRLKYFSFLNVNAIFSLSFILKFWINFLHYTYLKWDFYHSLLFCTLNSNWKRIDCAYVASQRIRNTSPELNQNSHWYQYFICQINL